MSETSWLVLGDTDEDKIGLLTEIRNNYVLLVKGEKKQFLGRKEVNKYFQQNIFDSVVEPVVEENIKKDYFINGYPVNFEGPNEVILKGNKLPLFSKKATSEIYYSAGYYCLNFPKNWMPAKDPKLSTLQTYEYAGPFHTELEMTTTLTRLRKEKKNLKK